MDALLNVLLVDTHVLQWWSAEPRRLSASATRALEAADEIAVAAISWLELAWLAQHGRIPIVVPLRTWLERLSRDVRTLPLTPAIAAHAVSLPETFPADPADRLIYATAVELGLRLITKDKRLRAYRSARPVALW